MGNLPLFDPRPPSRQALADRLAALAREGVHFGTSSWKYEGWLGNIYSPERYSVRGRFSRRKFEEECLHEYAETFPAVGGDFSFYQFPAPAYWQRLFHSAPASLRFGLKVPEEITVKTWPVHARYGPRAGQANESFLHAELFKEAFLRVLGPFSDRIGVLMFEFGTFPQAQYDSVEPFAADLDRFLGALPEGFRYGVEIRNREFLDSPYLECLRKHNVAHVFNAWTRMPELDRQVAHDEAYTADFLVARALLRRGRSYEQAVQLFQPYERIQDPNPGAREALRLLMERARRRGQLAFLFVNNRLEGNAPGTIDAVTGDAG